MRFQIQTQSALIWNPGFLDSTAHISEEATNAATAVPWALVIAIGIAGILGWGKSFFLSANRSSKTLNSDQRRIGLLYGQRFRDDRGERNRSAYGAGFLPKVSSLP